MNDTCFKTIKLDCTLFKSSEQVLLFGGSNTGKMHLVENLIKAYHERFYKIVLCGLKNRLLQFSKTAKKTEYYDNPNNHIRDPFQKIDEFDF